MASYNASNAECLIYSYKDGLLSAVAHDLQIRVTRWDMEVDPEARTVKATFDATSLEVVGAMHDGQLKASALSNGDKETIRNNIINDVLHAKKFGQVTFQSKTVTDSGSDFEVEGDLTLHGTTRSIRARIRLDRESYVTDIKLTQPDFGIKPYSAMLGTLKIKPDVKVVLKVPRAADLELHSDTVHEWLIYRMLHAKSYCDQDGRPLGEGKAPIHDRRAGIRFDMRPCPYPGSRAAVHGDKLMNTSAMKRLRTTMPEAFGAFLFLRSKFFAHLSEMRFVDLWRLSILAMAWPGFILWRRVPAMRDGELPPYVADVQKFAAGVSSLMLELALREATQRPTSLPEMTVDGLFDMADTMLVGEREVCAASPTLVLEGLSAFLDGRVSFKTSLPPWPAAMLDLQPLFHFSAAYADVQIFRWLMTSLHDCIVYDLAGGRTGWRPPGEALVHTDGLPMLAGIRHYILHSDPADRSILVLEVARRMLSQTGQTHRNLLAKLGKTLEALTEGGRLDSFVMGPPIEGTLRLNTTAAIRYLTFRAAAVDTLCDLEAGLRAPLGLAPMEGPGRPDLFTRVLGCSLI